MPVIEVHLSDIEAREEWRRHSVLEGIPLQADPRQPDGYREALDVLVRGGS